MSNIIKMEQQKTIVGLQAQGWSDRRIAKELGLHRATVKRYSDSKCTTVQTGKVSPTSLCSAYESEIKSWYESGLSIERIHTDLKLTHDFKGSYHSVYRFVKGLDDSGSKRVHRMECEPGEEAQIDYGTLFLHIGDNGRLKKIHILLVTLSHSRKSYVEAVLTQSSESFLRSLENAFRYFGGVAQRLCPDNLAAAVKKADWYEPEVNPKLRAFAQHYGTLIMPSDDILLIGPPGVGKSHIAQAIGYELIKQGKVVLYRSIFDILDDLKEDGMDAAHDRTMKRYTKCDLLIIDDMGIKQLPPKSGEYLFEIIMRRYEVRSTLMTSNRPLEEWGKLIGDVPAATAILDRFLHHAKVIKIKGNSYRLKDLARQNEPSN